MYNKRKCCRKWKWTHAIHTQRGLSTQTLEVHGEYVFLVKENQPQLYKNIQSLFAFAPDYPKPSFGKIQTEFLTSRKANKGHGRIETRTITTSEMLNAYASWSGAGLSPGTLISMAAQWTYLSHLTRSGIRDHQLDAQ